MLLLDTSTEAKSLKEKGIDVEILTQMMRARSEDKVADMLDTMGLLSLADEIEHLKHRSLIDHTLSKHFQFKNT